MRPFFSSHHAVNIQVIKTVNIVTITLSTMKSSQSSLSKSKTFQSMTELHYSNSVYTVQLHHVQYASYQEVAAACFQHHRTVASHPPLQPQCPRGLQCVTFLPGSLLLLTAWQMLSAQPLVLNIGRTEETENCSSRGIATRRVFLGDSVRCRHDRERASSSH